MNYDNQIMYWGVENYATKKVQAVIPKLLALYNYCVDEEYTETNVWEYGGGDRIVCYIPNDTKKILLFENQNVKFVVVIKDGFLPKLHIREVYENLFSEENKDYGFYSGGEFSNINELREGIKNENGLEIALLNLTSEYKKWADTIIGNKYPSRIDLDTMKNADFDKECPAFRYGDCRDKGYVLSYTFGRCEITDYQRSKYIFSDVTNAVSEVPESYLVAIKRNKLLDELL